MNSNVRVSSYITYLYINLDEPFSGSDQYPVLGQILVRAHEMLSKTRHFVSLHNLLCLYYAIFSGHMTYGSEIWGLNTSNNHFKKLASTKAMGIMSFSANNAPFEPIYKKCGFLNSRTKFLYLIAYLSMMKHLQPCTDLYDTSTRKRLRSLFTPHVNSHTYGCHSIKLSGILPWNHLSDTLGIYLMSMSKLALKNTK